jgi:hypothetical protein
VSAVRTKRLFSSRGALISRTRTLACAGVLALVGGGSTAFGAEPPALQQELEHAEQAVRDLEYEVANQVAARLVQAHGLTHDQLVRSYRILASTDAVLGKEAAAREAFQQLLLYEPTFEADANLSPKVRAPFMEAQGVARAQPVQPGIDVAVTLRPNTAGTIRVTTRDPTGVARRGTVSYRWSDAGAFTVAPVAIAKGATVDLPPPPQGTTRLDYYVEIFDERDDAIFESGTAAAPKSATVDLSAPVVTPGGGEVARTEPAPHRTFLASPIFWTVTGVVLAGVATGLYFAVRPENKTIESPGVPSPATSATLVPVLQCGAGHACN